MNYRNLFVALFISPLLLQGLCNTEDIKQACADVVTWDGNGKDGFYNSTETDSHFRELYFKTPDAPVDICTESEIQVVFRVPTSSSGSISNVLHINGIISWGDQFKIVVLPFSEAEHAYTGTLDRLDLKPYFDEHPTSDGSGYIEIEFNWSNLSIGSEQNDLKYITDNVIDMNVQVQYVRK